MSDNFQVRQAINSDARALSVLAAETFNDTFAFLFPPDEMSEFLKRTYSEEQILNQLEMPNYKTLLLVHDGSIVAYCMIRFGYREKQIFGPDPVAEIWRFYVSKSFIGRGAAKVLMDRVMETVKELKTVVAWLGVWENNFRAQKFYKKYGFQEVGCHTFLLIESTARDLLYQLNLC